MDRDMKEDPEQPNVQHMNTTRSLADVQIFSRIKICR